jgi:hypothetical protein
MHMYVLDTEFGVSLWVAGFFLCILYSCIAVEDMEVAGGK